MSPVLQGTRIGGRWFPYGPLPGELLTGGAGSFILGTTYPDASNSGIPAGVSMASTYDGAANGPGGSTVIVGSPDPDNPTRFYRTLFPRHIRVEQGYVDIDQSYLRGGPGTFNSGLVDTTALVDGRVRITRSDFEPTTKSYWMNATIGHHLTVERCRVRGTVDGFGSYNTGGARTDNYFRSNWIEYLTRYDVDVDHTDGTHNDSVQHQGGEGLWVEGNRFDGYTRYADGTTPADPWHRIAQGVLVQENVAYGGIYRCADIHVNRNYVRGHMHPFVFKTRSSGGTPYDVELRDNVWLNDDQRIYTGSLDRYNVRLGTETTTNGISYPTTGGTEDVFGNRYADDPEVSATWRGRAVLIRRDTFPGGAP